MQLAVGLKVPLPLLENVTVPVGVIAVPVSLSVTVAVQVDETVGGVQSTVVMVDRAVTVKLLLLVAVPSGVVTLTGPVVAPAGTVA